MYRTDVRISPKRHFNQLSRKIYPAQIFREQHRISLSSSAGAVFLRTQSNREKQNFRVKEVGPRGVYRKEARMKKKKKTKTNAHNDRIEAISEARENPSTDRSFSGIRGRIVYFPSATKIDGSFPRSLFLSRRGILLVLHRLAARYTG